MSDRRDRAEDRLRILTAYVAALEDPHALVDAVIGARSETDAVERVRAAFGLDETQAQAVCQRSFADARRDRLDRLRQEIAEVRRQLAAP